MTRDTDLIRRALLNIREISMTLEDEYGNPWIESNMIEREVAAALAALSAPAQEPPSPGVTAGATGEGGCGYPCGYDCNGACFTTPAPVVPAEGPISTLEMVYRNMPDIPELPEAYQPRNIARSLAALRSAPPVGARVTVQEAARVLLTDRAAIVRMVETAEDIYATGVSFNVIVGDALRALLPAGEGE